MKSSRIYQQRSLPCCLASFCDSTLTSKDLLKMRKHQILLADLITVSSAAGSDWQDGRDILSSDKITWKQSLLQRHRPTHLCTVFGIPGSQTKHTAKWKTTHSLRPPTDHQGHSVTFQTRRFWAMFGLLAQEQDTLYTLTVPWVSEGCLQTWKKKKKNPKNGNEASSGH